MNPVRLVLHASPRRCVRVDCSREETFVSNRVRHAIRFHIVSWLRKDGTFAARKVELYSNQGSYASHGHSIVAKAMGSFSQHYPCDNMECDAWTVFTNRPAAGAMRGYGMPQASFADESNVDECAKAVGMDRWPSGCRTSCPRASRTASPTTSTMRIPSASVWRLVRSTSTTTAKRRSSPRRPAPSATHRRGHLLV